MIVCSCRVLTDKDFLGTLRSETAESPRTAVEAYRCLGCSPECGRCLRMVKRILSEARSTSNCGSCRQTCFFNATGTHADDPALEEAA